MKERRSKRRKVSALAAGAAGVAAAYFFDPQMGRTRRAKARDRIAAMVRRAGRRLGLSHQGVGSSQRFAVGRCGREQRQGAREDVPPRTVGPGSLEAVIEDRGRKAT